MIEKKQNKKIYFEIMRIIAAFLVIFNHLPGYSLYYVSHGYKQWIYMFITMITRINVPIFFMISGALLLSKQETVKDVLCKRFIRMFILLLIFCLIMCFEGMVLGYRSTGEFEFNLRAFLTAFLSGNVGGTGAYWYIYSYLGFLLLLPYMRSIARNMDDQMFFLLIFLHACIFSIVPLINLIGQCQSVKWAISLESHFMIPIATEKAFFYPLVGYYIDKIDLKAIKKKTAYFAIFLTMFLIFVESLCTYVEFMQYGEMTQNYVQMFDYLISIVTFLLIKKIALNSSYIENQYIQRVILEIGGGNIDYLLDGSVLQISYL